MSRVNWLTRCGRWSTLLALVLATLAPGVAQALRHARGESLPWSQVCSATGSKRVVLAWSNGDDITPQQAHAFEQCVYCALHHDGAAPAGPVPALPLRADLSLVRPPLLHAPRPLFAWLSAQPRAPPALS